MIIHNTVISHILVVLITNDSHLNVDNKQIINFSHSHLAFFVAATQDSLHNYIENHNFKITGLAN